MKETLRVRAKAPKTVKRITKVLTLEDDLNKRKFFAYYQVSKDVDKWEPGYNLPTEYKMYLPDFDRLGRPKKIHITVTVVEDDDV